MGLKVRIPNSVRDRILGVQPPIGEIVAEHVSLLSKKPLLGTPVIGGPYDGAYAYEFRVSRLPLSRIFCLLYVLVEAEGAVDVLDFGILDGKPPRLSPPRFSITSLPD